MNSFNRWFERRLSVALNKEPISDYAINEPFNMTLGVKSKDSYTNKKIDKRGFDFTIHKANGGYLIEYRHYNEKDDRFDYALNVVHSDENLGEAVNQIMVYETLRK